VDGAVPRGLTDLHLDSGAWRILSIGPMPRRRP
jgi:hypothetical protein